MSAEEESNLGKSIWEEVYSRDNGEFFIKKSNTKKKKNKNKKEKNNNNNKPNPELPEEVTFNILVRLPPELLHTKFRYVCKQWNTIISSPFFIHQSMLKSNKPILIVQDLSNHKSKILEITDKDHLTHVCQSYPQYMPKARRRFRSSCNGILLVSYPKQEGELGVINPVIKQEIILPRCPSGCPHESCGCGLVFAASTGEYKVVHVYADLFGFEIFTLGCPDNAWIRVAGPFKDPYERPFGLAFRWDDPVLVKESMLHWNVDSYRYIISMDISDGKFRRTCLPKHNISVDGKIKSKNMLEMGGYLSIFYVSKIRIDVWILKDFEKQVWIKQHSIVPENVTYVNSAGCIPRVDNLTPVVVYGRVILFIHNCCGSKSGLYTYDMDSMKLRKFQIKVYHRHIFLSHVNTLYRIKVLDQASLNLEAAPATQG